MINDEALKSLLKKADELRSLFILGQRILPFLEEIFLFVGEIQPLLDEINHSIEENINKMPGASKQLSKVTEATELATTEILDIADGIVYKTELLTTNMNGMSDITEGFIQKTINILTVLLKGIAEKRDLSPITPELNETIRLLKEKVFFDYQNLKNKSDEVLQSMSMDSSSIMMSLQVQDITSQQIAAVNNLLTTVQSKLVKILTSFKNSGMERIIVEDNKEDDTNVSTLHRAIAFDPDAIDSLKNNEQRQENVDLIFSGQNQDFENFGMQQEEISESSNPNVDIIDESETVINNDVLDSFDSTEPFSQDDIDALFGK